MRQGQIGMTLDVAKYETVMEGEDMRAVVAPGAPSCTTGPKTRCRRLSSGLQFSLEVGVENSLIGVPFGSFGRG